MTLNQPARGEAPLLAIAVDPLRRRQGDPTAAPHLKGREAHLNQSKFAQALLAALNDHRPGADRPHLNLGE